MGEPIAKWETWTPERAASVLKAQQAENRHIRPTVVDRYAKDMAAGRWQENGETIIFNGARLLNGQHRLSAVIQSGVTLRLLTVREVAATTFATLDTGLSRTPGDTVRGELFHVFGGNYNVIAAAGGNIYEYLSSGDITSLPQHRPSRQELIKTVTDYSAELMGSLKQLHARQTHILGSPSRLLTWHFLCGRRYSEERDVFFNALVEGTDLRSDRPVRILRERLLAERASRRSLPARHLHAFYVKAWNSELLGRPMRLLRFNMGEPFPLLHGDVEPTSNR
jgi:hypothetical protein